jgi:hypothetical protein
VFLGSIPRSWGTGGHIWGHGMSTLGAYRHFWPEPSLVKCVGQEGPEAFIDEFQVCP